MNRSKLKSRAIYSSILLASLIAMGCSTNNQRQDSKDPVAADKAAGADASGLPPELRNVDGYDPATSIDSESVKNSDFYQVKKAVESNRVNLDNEWKAQDAQEEAVKKAKEDEKQRQLDQQKKEEAERAAQREEANKAYNKNAAKQARYTKEANERVKKLPTISKEEVLWNGLED